MIPLCSQNFLMTQPDNVEEDNEIPGSDSKELNEPMGKYSARSSAHSFVSTRPKRSQVSARRNAIIIPREDRSYRNVNSKKVGSKKDAAVQVIKLQKLAEKKASIEFQAQQKRADKGIFVLLFLINNSPRVTF